MSLSNYPPGMRESDIPGFNNTDGVRTVTCPECGVTSEDVDVEMSPGLRRYDDITIYAECPECEWTFEFTEEVPIDEPVDYRG